jgi:hypothetical protein
MLDAKVGFLAQSSRKRIFRFRPEPVIAACTAASSPEGERTFSKRQDANIARCAEIAEIDIVHRPCGCESGRRQSGHIVFLKLASGRPAIRADRRATQPARRQRAS